MKSVFLIAALTTTLIACNGAEPEASASASSNSSTGSGGAGGDGGQGGAGGFEPVPCSVSEDCVEIPRDVCHDVQCYMGACLDVASPLGTQCQGQTNPGMICNGLGACGEFMPYGGPDCFEPTAIPSESCPTCDDADPTTDDVCTTSPVPQCTHAPLPEGHYCGPWYTIQNGRCCPVPETTP